MTNDRRHFNCTFSIEDEKRICDDYRSGIRGKAITDKWGVNFTVIWRVLKAHNVFTTRKMISYDEAFFRVIDTEAKAYFLGLLTTDGYIVEGPKRYVVTLTSTDQDGPRAFSKVLGGKLPVYEIPPGHQRRNSIEYRVSVCSKIMVADLVALGVRQAKSTKEVFSNNVPDNLLNHYVRGLFDGDGSIGSYSSSGDRSQLKIGFVGSYQLLDSIASTFHDKAGIPQKHPTQKDGDLYRLQYSGNNISRDIARWLYRDATIYLGRKYQIYQESKNIDVRQWTKAHYGRRLMQSTDS